MAVDFWGALAEGGITGLFKGAGAFAKDVRTAITGKEALTSEQQMQIISQANALENAAQAQEQKAADGQIELNKIDAQSGSMFKGGWRPAIGWVCVSGLAYTFMVRPLLPWFVAVGCLLTGSPVEIPVMPPLDTAELIALTFSLLGFGGIRMYERIRGKA